MSVRVLSEHDVYRLLPVADCIEPMEEVLAALAREELYNPLRFVVRPPDEPTLMGLMPAHRGGDDPVYALKTVCIAPGNAARGLDSHQGFVALFDGETGATRALVNAGAITAIRTAAVTAVATRLLARPRLRTLAILGSGTQGRSHLEAMRAVLPFEEVRVWSRTPGNAAKLDGVEEVATPEEAVRGADVVVTVTSAREPIVRREWLAEGAHVNAVGSSIPTTRELDTETMAAAALFVDRRESTLNEAGDYLFPMREGAIGPEHIRAEIGELLIGAAEGRRSDSELTVFKSLGLAVEDLGRGRGGAGPRDGRGRRRRGRPLIPLDEILRARETIAGIAVRTPLLPLDVDADASIYLKLETLQPVNSFKIRGAGNAILQATDDELAGGVVTASAGNMAQGVAYAARLRGVPATIVVPEGAPETKVAAIERFGGRVVSLPYDDWWRILVEGRYEGSDGLFVHPVDNLRVMAGNGTIGLEILEDLPSVDAIIVPYGGGGLITGIASAVKASRPDVRFYAVEPETGAPVSATLASGSPAEVDYVRSFVDGAGSRSLIPGVWEHASTLIDGAFAVPLDDAAAAIRTIAERMRVIAEGAGALATAAAMAGKAGAGNVVCIVSGGNIDPRVLARILAGETP